VYVPLLVDDLPRFLDAFGRADFHGLSVTIPHKGAALAAADSTDPLAAAIGACNTLVRQPDGTFRGYNTDCSAAISAIERALLAGGGGGSAGGAGSPLAGKRFVVVGAGGAGRALAFGAAAKGARVVVVNRSRQRAEELVAALPAGTAEVAGWEELQAGRVRGDVLGNSTSLGMAPNVEETPVPAAALQGYQLVFDAVYTPLWTRLLRDARDAGCAVVDGLQMFVGQAVDQFELFTGAAAPVEVMREAVLGAAPAAPPAAAAAAAAKT
jgi:3-dehydroquinate dehydratase/shikimate dehydrogenase